MIEYEYALACGFTLGIWRGLLTADKLVDEATGAVERNSPEVMFEANDWLAPVSVAVWVVIAIFYANSLMGFLHIAAAPIGLFKIGQISVSGGARLLLQITYVKSMPSKRLRGLATVVGLVLFIGSCVPLSITDPCNDPDAYCE